MSKKIELYEKLKGETDPAWRAFVLYRDMKPRRIYNLVAQILHCHVNQVRGWSKAYMWPQRVLEWDREIDRQRQEVQKLEVRDMQRRHIKIASDVLDFAHKELRRLEALAKEGKLSTSLRDLVAAMKVAAELERLSRGQPTEIQETQESSVDLSKLSIEELKILHVVKTKVSAEG